MCDVIVAACLLGLESGVADQFRLVMYSKMVNVKFTRNVVCNKNGVHHTFKAPVYIWYDI